MRTDCMTGRPPSPWEVRTSLSEKEKLPLVGHLPCLHGFTSVLSNLPTVSSKRAGTGGLHARPTAGVFGGRRAAGWESSVCEWWWGRGSGQPAIACEGLSSCGWGLYLPGFQVRQQSLQLQGFPESLHLDHRVLELKGALNST